MRAMEVTIKVDGRRKGITRTFPVPEDEDEITRDHSVGLAIYRLFRDELTPEFMLIHRTQNDVLSWICESDDRDLLERDYIKMREARSSQ